MQVSQASVTQDLFSCCVLCLCSKYEKSETELSLPQSWGAVSRNEAVTLNEKAEQSVAGTNDNTKT